MLSSGAPEDSYSGFSVCLFGWVWFFETGFLCVALAVLGLTCGPGWPRTHRDPPASASGVLELKAYNNSFFKKRIIYLLFVSTLSLSSDTPEEGVRPHYRWLWATMWLLGFELRTSGRAVSALNHWAISPARVAWFLIWESELHVLSIIQILNNII